MAESRSLLLPPVPTVPFPEGTSVYLQLALLGVGTVGVPFLSKCQEMLESIQVLRDITEAGRMLRVFPL